MADTAQICNSAFSEGANGGYAFGQGFAPQVTASATRVFANRYVVKTNMKPQELAAFKTFLPVTVVEYAPEDDPASHAFHSEARRAMNRLAMRKVKRGSTVLVIAATFGEALEFVQVCPGVAFRFLIPWIGGKDAQRFEKGRTLAEEKRLTPGAIGVLAAQFLALDPRNPAGVQVSGPFTVVTSTEEWPVWRYDLAVALDVFLDVPPAQVRAWMRISGTPRVLFTMHYAAELFLLKRGEPLANAIFPHTWCRTASMTTVTAWNVVMNFDCASAGYVHPEEVVEAWWTHNHCREFHWEPVFANYGYGLFEGYLALPGFITVDKPLYMFPDFLRGFKVLDFLLYGKMKIFFVEGSKYREFRAYILQISVGKTLDYQKLMLKARSMQRKVVIVGAVLSEEWHQAGVSLEDIVAFAMLDVSLHTSDVMQTFKSIGRLIKNGGRLAEDALFNFTWMYNRVKAALAKVFKGRDMAKFLTDFANYQTYRVVQWTDIRQALWAFQDCLNFITGGATIGGVCDGVTMDHVETFKTEVLRYDPKAAEAVTHAGLKLMGFAREFSGQRVWYVGDAPGGMTQQLAIASTELEVFHPKVALIPTPYGWSTGKACYAASTMMFQQFGNVKHTFGLINSVDYGRATLIFSDVSCCDGTKCLGKLVCPNPVAWLNHWCAEVKRTGVTAIVKVNTPALEEVLNTLWSFGGLSYQPVKSHNPNPMSYELYLKISWSWALCVAHKSEVLRRSNERVRAVVMAWEPVMRRWSDYKLWVHMGCADAAKPELVGREVVCKSCKTMPAAPGKQKCLGCRQGGATRLDLVPDSVRELQASPRLAPPVKLEPMKAVVSGASSSARWLKRVKHQVERLASPRCSQRSCRNYHEACSAMCRACSEFGVQLIDMNMEEDTTSDDEEVVSSRLPAGPVKVTPGVMSLEEKCSKTGCFAVKLAWSAFCRDCHDEAAKLESSRHVRGECTLCHARGQVLRGTDSLCDACEPGVETQCLKCGVKAVRDPCGDCRVEAAAAPMAVEVESVTVAAVPDVESVALLPPTDEVLVVPGGSVSTWVSTAGGPTAAEVTTAVAILSTEPRVGTPIPGTAEVGLPTPVPVVAPVVPLTVVPTSPVDRAAPVVVVPEGKEEEEPAAASDVGPAAADEPVKLTRKVKEVKVTPLFGLLKEIAEIGGPKNVIEEFVKHKLLVSDFLFCPVTADGHCHPRAIQAVTYGSEDGWAQTVGRFAMKGVYIDGPNRMTARKIMEQAGVSYLDLVDKHLHLRPDRKRYGLVLLYKDHADVAIQTVDAKKPIFAKHPLIRRPENFDPEKAKFVEVDLEAVSGLNLEQVGRKLDLALNCSKSALYKDMHLRAQAFLKKHKGFLGGHRTRNIQAFFLNGVPGGNKTETALKWASLYKDQCLYVAPSGDGRAEFVERYYRYQGWVDPPESDEALGAQVKTWAAVFDPKPKKGYPLPNSVVRLIILDECFRHAVFYVQALAEVFPEAKFAFIGDVNQMSLDRSNYWEPTVTDRSLRLESVIEDFNVMGQPSGVGHFEVSVSRRFGPKAAALARRTKDVQLYVDNVREFEIRYQKTKDLSKLKNTSGVLNLITSKSEYSTDEIEQRGYSTVCASQGRSVDLTNLILTKDVMTTLARFRDTAYVALTRSKKSLVLHVVDSKAYVTGPGPRFRAMMNGPELKDIPESDDRIGGQFDGQSVTGRWIHAAWQRFEGMDEDFLREMPAGKPIATYPTFKKHQKVEKAPPIMPGLKFSRADLDPLLPFVDGGNAQESMVSNGTVLGEVQFLDANYLAKSATAATLAETFHGKRHFTSSFKHAANAFAHRVGMAKKGRELHSRIRMPSPEEAVDAFWNTYIDQEAFDKLMDSHAYLHFEVEAVNEFFSVAKLPLREAELTMRQFMMIIHGHAKQQMKARDLEATYGNKVAQPIVALEKALNVVFSTMFRVFVKVLRGSLKGKYCIPIGMTDEEVADWWKQNSKGMAEVFMCDMPEFDSTQTDKTLEYEFGIWCRMVGEKDLMGFYKRIRAGMMAYVGAWLKFKFSHWRGSGFPDTLIGNVIKQMVDWAIARKTSALPDSDQLVLAMMFFGDDMGAALKESHRSLFNMPVISSFYLKPLKVITHKSILEFCNKLFGEGRCVYNPMVMLKKIVNKNHTDVLSSKPKWDEYRDALQIVVLDYRKNFHKAVSVTAQWHGVSMAMAEYMILVCDSFAEVRYHEAESLLQPDEVIVEDIIGGQFQSTMATDAKCQLNEYAQKAAKPAPVYNTDVKMVGMKPMFTTKVEFDGQAVKGEAKDTKKEAEKSAAARLLAALTKIGGAQPEQEAKKPLTLAANNNVAALQYNAIFDAEKLAAEVIDLRYELQKFKYLGKGELNTLVRLVSQAKVSGTGDAEALQAAWNALMHATQGNTQVVPVTILTKELDAFDLRLFEHVKVPCDATFEGATWAQDNESLPEGWQVMSRVYGVSMAVFRYKREADGFKVEVSVLGAKNQVKVKGRRMPAPNDPTLPLERRLVHLLTEKTGIPKRYRRLLLHDMTEYLDSAYAVVETDPDDNSTPLVGPVAVKEAHESRVKVLQAEARAANRLAHATHGNQARVMTDPAQLNDFLQAHQATPASQLARQLKARYHDPQEELDAIARAYLYRTYDVSVAARESQNVPTFHCGADLDWETIHPCDSRDDRVNDLYRGLWKLWFLLTGRKKKDGWSDDWAEVLQRGRNKLMHSLEGNIKGLKKTLEEALPKPMGKEGKSKAQKERGRKEVREEKKPARPGPKKEEPKPALFGKKRDEHKKRRDRIVSHEPEVRHKGGAMVVRERGGSGSKNAWERAFEPSGRIPKGLLESYEKQMQMKRQILDEARRIYRAFMLPEDSDAVRFNDGMTTMETAVGSRLIYDVPVSFFTGPPPETESDDYPPSYEMWAFLFRSLTTAAIVLHQNRGEESWSYDLFVNNPLVSSQPAWQQAFEIDTIPTVVPIVLGHTRGTAKFRPHKDYYYTRIDESGRPFIWMDIGTFTVEVPNAGVWPTGSDNINISFDEWTPDGVREDVMHMGIGPGIGTTQTNPISKMGYFSLRVSGTGSSAIGMKALGLNVSGDGPVWGHWAAPYLDPNLDFIGQVRLLGNALRFQNTANAFAKNGSQLTCRIPATEYWHSIASAGFEELAQQPLKLDDINNSGVYLPSRPVQRSDTNMVARTQVDGDWVVRILDPLVLTAPFWVHALQINDPSGRGGRFIHSMSYEFTTANAMIERKKADCSEIALRIAMEWMAQAPLSSENPNHLQKFLGGIEKGGEMVDKYLPLATSIASLF